jgi:pimeloyl-ACP methyl ester carboxylesterase
VLVHGAGGTHLYWPPEIRHLPETAVYALDLPGHGASPLPACNTIGAYSEVVRDFVDALELPWFVLAGHSMGAAIALDFALAYTPRLAGIALLGGGARLRVSGALLEGIRHDFYGTTEMIVGRSYHPDTAADLKDLYLAHLRDVSPHLLLLDFLACHEFDVSDRLQTLTLPALIVVGSHDVMTPPALSAFLHAQIAGSTLAEVDGAGHNVMLEHPDAVAQLLTHFLDSIPA